MSALSHRLPFHRIGWRREHRQQDLLLVAGIPLGALLAYVLVTRSASQAFALVLLPVAAWLFTRSYMGLLIGVIAILAVPYWLVVGIPQASVLRIASVAAAVSFLYMRRSRLVLTDYALFIFVCVVVLGWLLQYDQRHAGHVVSTELTPIGFYLGARAIPRARVPVIFAGVLAAGTVGALTVLYEYFSGHAVFVDPSAYAWKATDSAIFRPGGIFASPPGASTVLSVVILLGFAGLSSLRGRRRALCAGCLGVCALALIVTFTRAGLIATGLGILVFLWLTRSPLLSPARVAWFATALAVVIVLLLPRLEGSATFQQGIVRPGQLSGRESYWTTALPIATASPHNLIFGIGTAALETPTVNAAATIPANVAATPQVFTTSLHSQYVTTLLEQGIVGVAALALLLSSVLVPAARAARSDRDVYLAALAASVVAVAVVLTVDTAFLQGPTFAIVMLVFGLATNLVSGRPNRGGAVTDGRQP